MADYDVYQSLETPQQFFEGMSPPQFPSTETAQPCACLVGLRPRRIQANDSTPPVELDDVVATQFQSHDLIDETLRSWLYLASMFRDKFCENENGVAACAQKLLSSKIFVENKDYVRTQIVYSLLQEDEPGSLHVIACFLLLNGRDDESVFNNMVGEACFPRLLELLNGRKEADPRLHRLLLELMYEMSRVERLRAEDLLQVDDGFIHYLFQIIEELSNDAHDPYHYPVIRVLVRCPCP